LALRDTTKGSTLRPVLKVLRMLAKELPRPPRSRMTHHVVDQRLPNDTLWELSRRRAAGGFQKNPFAPVEA